MMKKLMVILLALVMVFAFAACGGSGGGGEDPAEGGDTPQEPTAGLFDKYACGEYANLMASGEYYMESTSYAMGMEIKSKTAYGKNGTSDSISEVMGMTTHTLTTSDYVYTIDDAKKQYTATAITEELQEMTEEMTEQAAEEFDYENMVYTESGHGAIPNYDKDTAEYDYDEFSMTITEEGEDMTMTFRYYMDADGKLYAMYTNMGDGMEIVNVIDVLTGDIPAGMLELPAGYTEVDTATLYQ